MIEISPFAVDQASKSCLDMWQKTGPKDGFYSWLQSLVADAIQVSGCVSPVYHRTLKMQIVPMTTRRGDGYLLVSIERA